MKMISKRLFLFCISFLLSVLAEAQTYEIRALNKGNGYVGVEMRITSGTPPGSGGFITDLVFGLKWLSSYNVDLVSTIATSYNIIKSDVRKTKGVYYYQAFSASNTPFAFPAGWTLNSWVEIMSVKNTLTGANTGTFEIVEPGFDGTTELNYGVNLIDYKPAIAGSAINVPLPVKLTYFGAIPGNGIVSIKWITENEQNTKGFDIERTDADSNNYRSMAWLVGKGTIGGEYKWLDKDVKAGGKYYYRLRQVDRDGTFVYSEIRTAQLDEMSSTSIQLVPNPADKALKVIFSGALQTDKLVIKVMDTRGAKVMEKSYDLNSGRNLELNIAGLISGQYFLSIENDKGLIYAKAFLKK